MSNASPPSTELQLALAIPVASAPVTSVRLSSSQYNFTNNSIFISWVELLGDGTVASNKSLYLSAEQTQAFFGMALTGLPDLRTAFVQAFVLFISSVYGAVTVVTP